MLIFIADHNIHERTTQAVYDDYRAWCEDEGFKYPLTKIQFTRELVSHGFESKVFWDSAIKKRIRKFIKA